MIGNDLSAFINSCSEIGQDSFVDESFFNPEPNSHKEAPPRSSDAKSSAKATPEKVEPSEEKPKVSPAKQASPVQPPIPLKTASEEKEPLPVFDCIFCADERYVHQLCHDKCLVLTYAGTEDWMLHREVLYKFKSVSAKEFLG